MPVALAEGGSTKPPLLETAGQRVYQILIVDDDPATRDTGRMILENAGHACTEAENGPQALVLVRQQNFDLVLLDIDMPQMQGTEVLRQLRAEPD